MRILKLTMLAIIALALSACGDDKAASTASGEAAPAADSSMSDSSAPMASGMIDHSRDAVEFELRRSIGGLDRMIEQYTADGHATDELEAQKAELSASLDALMSG